VIKTQPTTPAAPVVGAITQPTYSLATGSVTLSGLPAGSWTLTRTPGGTNVSGTSATTIISGLPTGTYSFTVRNSVGCISDASANVVINNQPLVKNASIGLFESMTSKLPSDGIVISDDESVLIYPNPTHGKVTLKFNNIPAIGTKVLVYNALGKIIIQTVASGKEVNLDLTGKSPGFYFIRIGQTLPKTFKIILQ
jgi:hypothetical protein